MVAGEGKRSISGIRALFHLLSLDRFADAQRHDPSRGPGVVWPSYQALRDADVHSGDPLNGLVAAIGGRSHRWRSGPVPNVLLIPYFQRTRGNGAIGAAISLLLTELVLVGIGVVVIRSCFNREFLDRLARATLATAGMGLAVLAARSFGFAPAIVTGLVVYPVLAIWLGAVSLQELGQLLEIVQARKARVAVAPGIDS